MGTEWRYLIGDPADFDTRQIVGGGAALIDFDRDNDVDLFFPQAGSSADTAFQPGLFVNQLTETGVLKFIDRSDLLPTTGFGMGVATGDYDQDGWVDLYVTALGQDSLLRNLDGTGFHDVTAQAGIREKGWSTSAAFADFDNDGDPDLFVTRYVQFDPAVRCSGRLGRPDYCGPASYTPEPDLLYRNDNGHFREIASQVGLARPGPGLGVVTGDLDQDGWTDIYVANDGAANFLWRNHGDEGFTEDGLLTGTAVNPAGMAEASMGVALADIDSDGNLDLFMTHLGDESNRLLLNRGNNFFEDISDRSGVRLASSGPTGFGAVFFDPDLDGDLDIFIANGAVRVIRSQEGLPGLPLAQPNQLLIQDNSGRYVDVSGENSALAELAVSRGLALGDLDNDGDEDLVVVNTESPVQILLSNSPPDHHWIGFDLVDAYGAPAIGATVELTGRDGPRIVPVRTDGSYLSASDPRVIFGLGAQANPVDATIRWPDGSVSRHKRLLAGRYHQFSASN